MGQSILFEMNVAKTNSEEVFKCLSLSKLPLSCCPFMATFFMWPGICPSMSIEYLFNQAATRSPRRSNLLVLFFDLGRGVGGIACDLHSLLKRFVTNLTS